MNNESDDSRTTEVLEALVRQLSDKDKADRKRDEAERSAEKKTKHLYLGIVASILTIFSAVALQLGTPPRVAKKSDIVDVIKQRQDIIRPDKWTSIDDEKAMRRQRELIDERYTDVKKSITNIERRLNEGESREHDRLDYLTAKQKDVINNVDKLGEKINDHTSGSSGRTNRLLSLERRMNRLEKN